jgi:HD-like signal output (HDOD) protein
VLLPDPAQQALVEELTPTVLAYALKHQPAPTSFPTLARRALARRSLELEELVRIAAEDVAIGAAILRAANSPLFYRGSQIDGTRNAVSLLGQVASGQIVTGVASRALFDLQTRAEYDLFPQAFNRLFHHAMTTAMTASWLADHKRLPQSERAFSGGLFANIGKLVALRALSALVLDGRVPHPLPELVINRILDVVHVQVGADFHKRWSLGPELHQICSMHLDAEVPLGPQYAALHLVRVASGLDELRIDPVMNAGVAPETRQSVRALGLSKADVTALVAKLGEIAGHVTTTFG